MKIIGIGDFFIPAEFIDKGFASFKNEGYDVSTISWNLKDVEEFQHINLLVEDKRCRYNHHTVLPNVKESYR